MASSISEPSEFGDEEQFLFYGPWLVEFAVSLARAAYGRKNAVRPLQALRDGLMAVAAFWFLAVFPFDFTQRADLLPRSVQFAFLWVNNDIGALILVIIAVAGLASMVYNSAMFVVISHAESTGHTGVGSPPSGWQA